MLFSIRNAWLLLRHHSAVPAGGGAVAADGPSAPGSEGPAEAPAPTAGVLEELSGALASARVVLSSFLELMSLEARRAGLALVWMVACGVVGAICFVAAWMGLMAAVAMWAVSLGMSPLAAVLAVVAINCVAGAVLIYICIGMSRDLLFAATRRQVAGKSRLKSPAA